MYREHLLIGPRSVLHGSILNGASSYSLSQYICIYIYIGHPSRICWGQIGFHHMPILPWCPTRVKPCQPPSFPRGTWHDGWSWYGLHIIYIYIYMYIYTWQCWVLMRYTEIRFAQEEKKSPFHNSLRLNQNLCHGVRWARGGIALCCFPSDRSSKHLRIFSYMYTM